MPLPHCAPLMVTMFLLVERHCVLTELRPMALQMLPTVQGEKAVIPAGVNGFMM